MAVVTDQTRGCKDCPYGNRYHVGCFTVLTVDYGFRVVDAEIDVS